MAVTLTGTPIIGNYGAVGLSQAYATPAGSDLLLAFILNADGSNRSLTAITHHGNAMTAIPSFAIFDSVFCKVMGYSCIPDIGTFNVNATYDTNPSGSMYIILSLSGVDPTTPFGTAVTKGTTTTTPNVTIASGTGAYPIFVILSDQDAGISVVGTPTALVTTTPFFFSDVWAGASTYTPAASVNGGWTQASAAAAVAGVSVMPVGGVGGSDTLWAQSLMGLGALASLGSLLRPLARQREAVARGRSFVAMPSGLFVPDWMAA